MMHWYPVPACVAATDDGDEMVCVPFDKSWRWFVRSRDGHILGSGEAATEADAKAMASEVAAVPFGGAA